MKTILYLIPHLGNSSPVTQLLGIISYLEPQKYNAVVLSFFKEKPNSVQKKFEDNGVTVINGNLERWQLRRQEKLLYKIVDEIKPDIVHSCSVLTDGICSGVNISMPIVLTLHCFVYEDILTRYGKILGKIICRREMKTLRKASSVVACSNSLAQKYNNIIDVKMIPIQNGIETTLWDMDEKMTKRILREKLGLNRNSYIVLSTGLLESIKDPLLLINSFKLAQIPNAELVMLGNGRLEKECKKHAAQNIHFTGRVENVKEYLYAADVLVSASKSEGLPYAVLEAECTGIRMILSDIPQHREVAGNNSGVKFFQCGNELELASYLKDDSKNQFRVSYDLTRFTAKHMSEKYQEIYNGLPFTIVI